MIEQGMRGMIGKGLRSQEVIDACVEHGAVYFAAIGGAAAVIAKSIKGEEMIAYEDLGPEAIRRYEVKDFLLSFVSTAKATIFIKLALPNTVKSNKFNKSLRNCRSSSLFFAKVLTSLFSLSYQMPIE